MCICKISEGLADFWGFTAICTTEDYLCICGTIQQLGENKNITVHKATNYIDQSRRYHYKSSNQMVQHWRNDREILGNNKNTCGWHTTLWSVDEFFINFVLQRTMVTLFFWWTFWTPIQCDFQQLCSQWGCLQLF